MHFHRSQHDHHGPTNQRTDKALPIGEILNKDLRISVKTGCVNRPMPGSRFCEKHEPFVITSKEGLAFLITSLNRFTVLFTIMESWFICFGIIQARKQ